MLRQTCLEIGIISIRGDSLFVESDILEPGDARATPTGGLLQSRYFLDHGCLKIASTTRLTQEQPEDTPSDDNESLRDVAAKSGWSAKSLDFLSEKAFPKAHFSAAGGGWVKLIQATGAVSYLSLNEHTNSQMPLLFVSCVHGDPGLELLDGVDSPGSSVRVSVIYGTSPTEEEVWFVAPNYMLIPPNPKRAAFRALSSITFALVSSGQGGLFSTEGLPYSSVETTCRKALQ